MRMIGRLESSLLVKKTRRRKFCFSLFVFCMVSLTVYSLQLYVVTERYYNPPKSHFTNNYFLAAEDAIALGFTVNTPTCNILNISAWDQAILPLLIEEDIPRKNCHLRQRQWTYQEGMNLIINVSSLAESGYSMGTVTCCYYTITRVEQSINNYDSKADERVRYSSTCSPLEVVVNRMTSPFIRVHCRGKYWPLSSDVLYRQFHAFAVSPDEPKVQSKIRYWKRKSQRKEPEIPFQKPPNVVIIGIDSMSRLSFHRTMPKTRAMLEGLGAVEMLGYTKVGENTLPNIMAALSGYLEANLRDSCFFDNDTPQDECPYLWKRFSRANYMTAFIEDAPLLAIFHYLKTGFVKQPTDIYLRPFMLGVYQHEPTPYFTIDCIGTESVDEVILRYIANVMKMATDIDVPLFLLSWMTNLAHGSLVGGKYADELYADFLKNLDLNNTLLFFMSDHGYRFGSIRQTFAGWYEDKLPNFWVYLPQTLGTKHSDWLPTLKTNSMRLTSTFDLYRTMSHILNEFTTTPELPVIKHKTTGLEIGRKFGQSFFEEVPILRECIGAGIAESFCACVVPQRLSTNDSLLEKSAEAAIVHINSFLPPQCAKLKILSIEAGAVAKYRQNSRDGTTNSTYIVAFVTQPGQFIFEANVNFFSRNGNVTTEPLQQEFHVSMDILRMNRISTDVSCIRDGFLEKFCYCDSTSTLIKKTTLS